MKKKSFGFVVSLMLILVLTGCGNTKSNSENNTSKNNLSSTVEIGDYIDYNAEVGKTYTAALDDTGYSEDQTFEVMGDEKWRVLSIEEDGTVNIILDGVIKDKDDSALLLKGKTGYTNGVKTLNNICAIYGSGEFADSARSLTTNDIYSMFDMDAVVEFYQDEYKTEITETTRKEQLQKIFDLSHTYNGEAVTINGVQYTVNSEIELNSSSIGHAHAMNLEDAISDEKYLDVLISEDDKIWLGTDASEWGSSVTSGSEGYVNFGIYSFYYTSYSNGLAMETLYSTYDDKDESFSYYLRPVVTLKTGLSVASGNGTEEDPYTLK